MALEGHICHVHRLQMDPLDSDVQIRVRNIYSIRQDGHIKVQSWSLVLAIRPLLMREQGGELLGLDLREQNLGNQKQILISPTHR